MRPPLFATEWWLSARSGARGAAVRRSEQERQRGNLTKDEFERINRKARNVLKKKGNKKD
jgi:hypothetical protein